MSIFGTKKAAKKRAENNANWQNFNRNMTSWKSSNPENFARNSSEISRKFAKKSDENLRKVSKFSPEISRKSEKINEKINENSSGNFAKNEQKKSRKFEKNRHEKNEKNEKIFAKNAIKNANENANFTFRRNATLSDLQRENREKSERQHEKDLRARRRKIGILLMVVAGICAIFVAILSQFSGNFRIESGVKLSETETQKYAKIVEQYFAKNPFERFSFGRRDEEFAKFVEQDAPEIKGVKFGFAGFGGGKIELSFRQPIAMWNGGGEVNFVDDAGVVFAKNYFGNPSVTITDENSVQTSSGQTASGGFLSFVGQVSAELAKSGLVLEKVVIPRGAIRYANIYLQGRNYPFMAQIDREPAEQAADIAAIAKYLDANQIAPQYVDVRVRGRAYWK